MGETSTAFLVRSILFSANFLIIGPNADSNSTFGTCSKLNQAPPLGEPRPASTSLMIA